MATCVWRTASRGLKLLTKSQHFTVRRYILSEAYKCQNVWKERLASPVLQQIDLSEYIVQLKDKFDREGRASPVDIDILANKLHQAADDQIMIVETLFHRFRKTGEGFPIRESTVHAIIRSYIDLDLPDRLLPMMKDRINYGVFPDHFAASLLMDCFIDHSYYNDAATVAYELMLQEDYSNQTSMLMSLYSCIKHLIHSPPSKPEEAVQGDDEDINWVRVDWIRNQFYDEHFQINDDRFLLGKTIMVIGRQIGDTDLGMSMQVLGAGLFNKFPVGLKVLEDVLNGSTSVFAEAIEKFKVSLEEADVRDLDEADIDINERVFEDEVRLYRITDVEKKEYLDKFQYLHGELLEKNKILEASIEKTVEEYVTTEIKKYEQSDIDSQCEVYKKWVEDREDMLNEQTKLLLRQQKRNDILAKLRQLHEKEQLLSFFDNKDRIGYLSDQTTVQEGEEIQLERATK